MREWLWAGHPFSKRNKKLGVSLSRYKGQGNIFLLFLDAVHQVSICINSSGQLALVRSLLKVIAGQLVTTR